MQARRIGLLSALLALGCAMDQPAPVQRDASAPAPAISAARVAELSRALEKIRGRKFKREVDVTFVTLAQLRPRLQAMFDEEMPATRLRREAAYLRALRLLPAGADLRGLYLSLLGAQVVGLYDPTSRALYVVTDTRPPAGGAPADLPGASLTDIAIVHELDHALSDQYFSLDARFRTVRGNRDAEAALQALIEGEATLAMVQYALRASLGSGADAEGELLASVAQQLDPGSLKGLTAGDPSLRGIPPFLVQRLAASYTDGFQYALRAWRRGGWNAVDALYDDPPRSTSEVLGGARRAGPPPADPDCAPGTAILRESPGAQDLRLWSFIETGVAPGPEAPPAGDSRLAVCRLPGGADELRWTVAWAGGGPPDALRDAARKAWPAAHLDWRAGGPVTIIATLPAD